MRTITGAPPENVMTIGKFECLHLGHQSLIQLAAKRSRALGLPLVVMTFDPHPRKVLGGGDFVPLVPLDQVARVLENQFQVDYYLRYPFTKELSQMSPKAFCKILFAELMAREVIVGEDYRFGVDRSGGVEFLENEARHYDAHVTVVPSIKIGGLVVSSSRIRELVEMGRLDEAQELAGFCIAQQIQHS